MRINKLVFGLVVLLIVTMIWGITFSHSLQEYEKYCDWIREQKLGNPIPYYGWDVGKYVNLTLIILPFLWIPFLDYFLRKMTYPFLRQKLTYRSFKRFCRSVSRSLYEGLYGLVFGYFTRINRRVGAKISFWFMKVETFEHVHFLTKVFKWIVLPSSILYVTIEISFFRQNVLDSMFTGIALFFYCSFLPDLPAIFRRKVYRDVRDAFYEDLPGYKKYALLLFTPLFIVLLYCGVKIKWRTTETFHNFKSLTIYSGFLFILIFIVFADFPISIGGIIEVLCVLLYAVLGYLTHLKVDLVF